MDRPPVGYCVRVGVSVCASLAAHSLSLPGPRIPGWFSDAARKTWNLWDVYHAEDPSQKVRDVDVHHFPSATSVAVTL
ncbi:hypothetical protein BD414DRAFT_311964 [Trametes punicea]|nr:hypothetical protein BD414DRAFT_311964 [Trametes punicea]